MTILTLPLVLSQTYEDCKLQNEPSNKPMVAVVLVLLLVVLEVLLLFSNHTISCWGNSFVGSGLLGFGSGDKADGRDPETAGRG